MNCEINFDLDFINNLLQQNLPEYQFVKEAVEFLENTIPVYINNEKEIKELFVSFNGGKDATIILSLTYIALKNLQQKKPQLFKNDTDYIHTIYFEEKDSFEEVDKFIENCKTLFNFTQIKLERDFKSQLQYMIDNHQLKAVIMGSRRDDPYCEKLEKISPSDYHKGYPQFLRINPIIDWKYDQVWKFLLDFKIPYCCLYNQGYTYLGNKSNTQKNESLVSDGQYKPAYDLKEHNLEQASRSQIQISNNNNATQQNNNRRQISYLIIGDWEFHQEQISNICKNSSKAVYFINISKNQQDQKVVVDKSQYQSLSVGTDLKIITNIENNIVYK